MARLLPPPQNARQPHPSRRRLGRRPALPRYNGVLGLDGRRGGAAGVGGAVGYSELGGDGDVFEEVAVGCEGVSGADECDEFVAVAEGGEVDFSIYIKHQYT